MELKLIPSTSQQAPPAGAETPSAKHQISNKQQAPDPKSQTGRPHSAGVSILGARDLGLGISRLGAVLAPTILSCLLLVAGCATAPSPRPTDTAASAATPGPMKSPTRGPIMTFEKKIHDFGEIGLQSKHTCEFRFKNTGSGVLKVKKEIDSTCGCTVPVLSKTEYAPGEDGTIEVTYMAGVSCGSASKSLVVYSNDKSDGGAARLTIQAKVVERVACEPRQLVLRLKGPDAGCPPITVRSLDHQSFSVTRILSTGGTLTMDCDPSLQAAEFTFRPTLDSKQLQKYPTGTLLLTLTHPECEEVRIRYQILPELEFRPPSIMLVNVEPNRPILKEVWLWNNYGEDFEIASCTAAAKSVEIADEEKVVSKDQKSFCYHLRLALKPPPVSGTQRVFSDTLAIRLTDGRTLQLPCRFLYGGPQVPVPNVPVRPRQGQAK